MPGVERTFYSRVQRRRSVAAWTFGRCLERRTASSLSCDARVRSISAPNLMPKKISAGILLYRVRDNVVEVFLVHPGGPYWERKDDGAWSIPKGEATEGADLLTAAYNEFHEETGSRVEGRPVPLAPLTQPGGKLVHAWAVRGDIDATSIRSNTFSIEWPPRSGKRAEFPEVDRAGWFDLPIARQKLLPGQRGFLDQLQEQLGKRPTAKSDGVR
jgi:predicted NUDIX family NTP pyrophosphohydrolase